MRVSGVFSGAYKTDIFHIVYGVKLHLFFTHS